MVKPNQVSGAKAKKKTNDYSKNVVDQQKVDLMCVPFKDYFKQILYYVDSVLREAPMEKKTANRGDNVSLRWRGREGGVALSCHFLQIYGVVTKSGQCFL